MCLFGIVERPGVSWGVLGCPGVIRLTRMKPKVRARAAELNAEPELLKFKANITYLIKSKAQKYHILHNQHKILSKIMTYG